MNILMTTDTIGGVWNYCIDLSRHLQRFDASVYLVSMGGPLSKAQRTAVSSLENVTLFESHYKLCWMRDPWRDVEAAGNFLLSVAEDIKPDIIHLNDFPHGNLPWDCPVLMVGHSCVFTWFEAVKGTRPDETWNRYHTSVKAGLLAADLVVAPTRAMLNGLKHHYGPLPQTTVISNGSDAEHFYTATKMPYIMSAGRIWDDAKNIQALLRAAPQIRWKVFLAGNHLHPDGSEKPVEPLKALGQLSTAEIAHLYAKASIYVSPAFYEPFGLSVLEAAMSQCALVLSDIESLRETWDGVAIFIPANDPDALASAVNALIEAPQRRDRAAKLARQRSFAFSADRMAQAYHSCYQTLHAIEQGKVELPCES
jgi:glycogen synthase